MNDGSLTENMPPEAEQARPEADQAEPAGAQRVGPPPVTEARVLDELCAIAFSDFTDYVRVEDGAAVITDSLSLDRGRRAAIAGIKEAGKGVEIKLHDKEKALELLVKYLGLFRGAEESGGVRVVIDPEAEAWAE